MLFKRTVRKMGYPSKYVGRYPHLAKWLKKIGHAVYPMEMRCKPIFVERPNRKWRNERTAFLYGNVDVVSYFQDELWAWEYKSQTDSLKRGYFQLQNYALYFDRVCLATEASLSGKWYEKIVDIGAGVFAECAEGFILVEEPKLNQTNTLRHDRLVERFKKNVFKIKRKKRTQVDPAQKQLTAFSLNTR